MDSPDDKQLQAWIIKAGYSRPPFKALYAEDDEYLELHFTPHAGHFEEYAERASTIIVGARGSGKTANCIQLEKALRRDPMSLVLVYNDLAPVRTLSASEPPSLQHHLWQIVHLGVETLLSEKGDELTRAVKHDLVQIQRRCEEFQRVAPYSKWLEILKEAAWSVGYESIYLLIDERDSSHRAPAESPRLLEPLLQSDLFNLDRFYVKLFVPSELEERANELAELYQVPICRIRWTTEELYLLLQNLMTRARVSAQDEPFGAWLGTSRELGRIAQVSYSPDIDHEFTQKVAACDPMPRSLVQLGQILFNQCAHNWEPRQEARVGDEEWSAALNKWLGALSVKRKPPLLEKVSLRFVECRSGRGKTLVQILVQNSPADLIVLPYSPTELWTVLWALNKWAAGDLTVLDRSPHLRVLKKFKYLKSTRPPRLVIDLEKRVGDHLYQCLSTSRYFVEAIRQKTELVQNLRYQGRDARVWLEFRFDPNALCAASYPWELLYRQGLLLLTTESYELTRYLQLDEDEPPLELARPFSLLYVAPRPRQDGLTLDESRITEAFQQVGVRLELRPLDPPTFANLRRVNDDGSYLVWHFDGHGTFERWCPTCKKRIPPWSETCTKGHTTEGPFGFLEFASASGRSDLRQASDVLSALYGSRVRLALINGCKTSVQAAGPEFGVAPALLRARIPAVVTMLLSISDQAASLFVEGFYQTLAAALEGGEFSGLAVATVLIQAVRAGRQRVLDAQDEDESLKQLIRRQWFMPVVHLRYDSGGRP